MRTPTVALTTITAAMVLTAGWYVGARPSSAALPGVHVVAVPSVPADPAPRAGSGSGTGARAGQNATARPRKKVRRSIDGALVATPYGNVQVRLLLTGRRITDVRSLQLTDANGESRRISARAAPVLRSEALAAQSAQIDAVSGATYTSEGYQQSLQAALDAAHR